MTDDASLTDFVSPSDRDGDETTADPESSTTPPTAEANDTGDSEREAGGDDHDRETPSTYAWGAYTCTRCGESTDRVWRDDGAFVCPSCKTW